MTPEAQEILDKLLDQDTDWLQPADLAIGIAVQQITLRGSEIITTRIKPEEFYRGKT